MYGRTSLHFAAYHGRSEIIHQLLGAGLDSSIQDAFGKTAVHYARENEHFEAARWCWLGKSFKCTRNVWSFFDSHDVNRFLKLA